MRKSALDKIIAKALSLTPSGLATLARAVADPEGWATGDGKGYGAMSACAKLAKDGLVELAEWRSPNFNHTYHRYRITDAGRERIAQARKYGW
jgi:hypothetical protein